MILVSQLFQTTNILQTFHGEVLASGLLSQTILPIASTPAISTSFRIFHMNKTNSTDHFTVPSLVNMQSFIRIRCKVRKQWNPKEMFAKRLMIVCISMRFNRRFHVAWFKEKCVHRFWLLFIAGGFQSYYVNCRLTERRHRRKIFIWYFASIP